MKSHFVLVTLIVLILALLGGVYLAGYRVGPGLSLLKTRTLTIDDLPKGALVYVDQAARGSAAGGQIALALTPGNHTLLAAADGYWPWEEIAVVPENAATTVHSFLVPKEVSPTELTGTSATAALKVVDSAKLPTASTSQALAGGCAFISVSNNRILGEAASTSSCTPPPYLCTGGDCSSTILFSPVEILRSVVPYPGRTDALLVAVGGQVYALEVDPRTPRTFAPILTGVAPLIAESADGTLLIKDAGKIYSLAL